MVPISDNSRPGLRRVVKFSGMLPVGLHFRVAVGRLASVHGNTWALSSETPLTLEVMGVPGAFLRGKGDKQELLLPVPREPLAGEKEPKLMIDYWFQK